MFRLILTTIAYLFFLEVALAHLKHQAAGEIPEVTN